MKPLVQKVNMINFKKKENHPVIKETTIIENSKLQTIPKLPQCNIKIQTGYPTRNSFHTNPRNKYKSRRAMIHFTITLITIANKTSPQNTTNLFTEECKRHKNIKQLPGSLKQTSYQKIIKEAERPSWRTFWNFIKKISRKTSALINHLSWKNKCH